MMARSYSLAVVSARIWRIGSPERTTISGKTSSLLSIAASLSSARRSGFSSPGSSTMPSRVFFEWHGPAISPPSRVGLSAGSVPSLQTRMRMDCLKFVPCKQSVDHNGPADQREWNEKKTNLRSGEILGEDGTDLGADRGAGVHYQGNQN